MLDPSPSPPSSAGDIDARPPLSAVLPPLILGTATFNTQYVADPTRMPYTDIVSRALDLGVPAFDTSPYYGPSEILLGQALHSLITPPPSSTSPDADAVHVQPPSPRHKRDDYFLITKAGRIAGDEFDYSPAWIRYSVLRSLRRLHTPYLDLVYTHDVEFVSPAEVLAAVRELRRLRDEGLIRYVGISGYPVPVLCGLAEMIRRETGEPLDAVMSYCHCSLQNDTLAAGYTATSTAAPAPAQDSTAHPLDRFRAAGVNVVLNASMPGMGLLTTRGVDNGPQAAWHPSPAALRQACAAVAAATTAAGEKLERVAIRYALDTWSRAGAAAGLGVGVGVGARELEGGRPLGASVMGVSSLAELEETWAVWQSVLDSLRPSGELVDEADQERCDAAVKRYEDVQDLVHNTLWPVLGSWRNHSWASGGPGFVNTRRPEDLGTTPDDGLVEAFEKTAQETPIVAKKLDVIVKAVEVTTA